MEISLLRMLVDTSCPAERYERHGLKPVFVVNFFAGSLESASQGCRIQCDAASAIAVSHDPGRKKLKTVKACGQSLAIQGIDQIK